MEADAINSSTVLMEGPVVPRVLRQSASLISQKSGCSSRDAVTGPTSESLQMSRERKHTF